MGIIKSCKNIHACIQGDENRELRFSLDRIWDEQRTKVLFILLNPSKGTALKIDNSIVNINNYCVDKGYGGYRVVNLFPLMATERKELSGKLNCGSDKNNEVIRESIKSTSVIYIAWGSTDNYINKKREVEGLVFQLCDGKEVLCWQDARGSYPRHLRILSKDWEVVPYQYKYISRV